MHTTTDIPTFKYFNFTGDLYIKPVPATEKIPRRSWKYLIMGPTGAGKSTFIEALSGATQDLQISKDQLAGYTQNVTAYQLMNVEFEGWLIHLVDTPGFSDTKISESEIMEMVRNWLAENNLSYFDAILFLIPITQPRLAGSKRRTIEMLKAFLKPSDNLRSITFVTTMWNLLYSERTQQRAESNFVQLGDDILKEFIDEGATVEKFRNTRDSVLQILDTTYKRGVAFSQTVVPHGSSHLYQDLHERIEGMLQQKRSLEADMASPEGQTSDALKSILESVHRDNEETLVKFIGQLVRFGKPPEGFEDAYQRLWKEIECMNLDLADEDLASTRYHPASPPEDVSLSSALPHAAPRDIITAAQSQPATFGDAAPFSPSHPVVEHSPTAVAQIHPTRMLTLKGLIRRVIRAAQGRGKKWFRESKD